MDVAKAWPDSLAGVLLKQDRTDSEERLTRLIEQTGGTMRRKVLEAISAARRQAGDLDELADRIERGEFDTISDRLARIAAAVIGAGYASIYTTAGERTADHLGDMLETTITFDQVGDRAVRHMQTERFRIVGAFVREQHDATRTALVFGFRHGDSARRQAETLVNSIGLTRSQTETVERYRQALDRSHERLSDALSRDLRDRRHDRTVRRARREGEPLTGEQIDRMTDRYREGYRRYRADVIGRTEAHRAVHAANDEAYRQIIDEGRIDRTRVRRRWIAAADERVRPSHIALNGVVRGIDETFPGFDGELRYPGDPNAPSSETVACRCVLSTNLPEL